MSFILESTSTCSTTRKVLFFQKRGNPGDLGRNPGYQGWKINSVLHDCIQGFNSVAPLLFLWKWELFCFYFHRKNKSQVTCQWRFNDLQDPAGRAVSTYVGLISVVDKIQLSEQYNSIVYLEIRSFSGFVGCWDQILVKQVVYVQECFLWLTTRCRIFGVKSLFALCIRC